MPDPQPKTPNFSGDVLWMDPAPWTKYHYLCAKADTEVGFMCRTHPDDPLHIIDIVVVKQESTSVTVDFDDEGLEDYMMANIAAGRSPRDFFRVWAHTHPGDSPHPSGTDEKTNLECFSGADWNVMLILAKGGDTYARLTVRSSSCTMSKILRVTQNHNAWKSAVMDTVAWDAELAANLRRPAPSNYASSTITPAASWLDPEDKESIHHIYKNGNTGVRTWMRAAHPDMKERFDATDANDCLTVPKPNFDDNEDWDPSWNHDQPLGLTPLYDDDTDEWGHLNLKLCEPEVQTWYDEKVEEASYTAQILNANTDCDTDAWFKDFEDDYRFCQRVLVAADRILDTKPLELTMEMCRQIEKECLHVHVT
jgi:hypothetical protein